MQVICLKFKAYRLFGKRLDHINLKGNIRVLLAFLYSIDNQRNAFKHMKINLKNSVFTNEIAWYWRRLVFD